MTDPEFNRDAFIFFWIGIIVIIIGAILQNEFFIFLGAGAVAIICIALAINLFGNPFHCVDEKH